MALSKKETDRLLRSKLIRQCLTLIRELKEDVPAAIPVNLIAPLVESSAKLLGRKLVYDEIREVEGVAGEQATYNHIVETGVCGECGAPSIREIALCAECHERYSRLEAQIDFDNLRTLTGTKH